jgi:hypothetical protein
MLHSKNNSQAQTAKWAVPSSRLDFRIPWLYMAYASSTSFRPNSAAPFRHDDDSESVSNVRLLIAAGLYHVIFLAWPHHSQRTPESFEDHSSLLVPFLMWLQTNKNYMFVPSAGSPPTMRDPTELFSQNPGTPCWTPPWKQVLSSLHCTEFCHLGIADPETSSCHNSCVAHQHSSNSVNPQTFRTWHSPLSQMRCILRWIDEQVALA